MPLTAFPHGTYSTLDENLTVEDFLHGADVAMHQYMHIFNVTGHPSVSVPLFQGEDGLPIGVQIVGRFGEEATCSCRPRPGRGDSLGRATAACVCWRPSIGPNVHASRPLGRASRGGQVVLSRQVRTNFISRLAKRATGLMRTNGWSTPPL
ncbi:amidase [Mesorhizobium sp. LMG 17147]|uniref:amidase family protein n=1 Tax=Mesorhizobium sp. LMG 17147 TaxID=2963091 RepID=UPI0020C9D14C|nr:amidase family protein [Mesorhizobium sp. LMG 17147]MCP9232823.1 amidase [Mesorhizobium sp. LMG 17147]